MSCTAALPLSPFRVNVRSYVPHTARALDFITPSPIICPTDTKSGRYIQRQRRLEMNALKAIAKKKTLFALMLALTIFGAVYGFAATLSVGTNTLSAGNASVASCQASGSPTGTYTVAYDSTLPGYKVSTVNVTGIDAACNTKAISVTLTGASNANLATVPGTISGTSIALAVPGTISAAAVTGVSV